MCWAISNLYNTFYDKYSYYIDLIQSKETFVAQEAPIASGINSGKLNALGIYYYTKLGEMSSYSLIKTYHPIKLKVFHHKKKYCKQDTINVVEDILDYFKSIGYSITIKYSRTKKELNITDGEADAFMYAVKSYIDDRRLSKVAKDILAKYPRFDVMQSIEEKINDEISDE